MFKLFDLLRNVLLVMGLVMSLVACKKAPDAATDTAAPASAPATINVLDELQTAPSKVFQATPDDAADIAQLTQFEQNFSTQSEQMEIELEKLQQQGQIKPHEVLDRKFYNIQQGLKQLNALALKTEQGLYIQGLWQQYWQNQQQVLRQQSQAQSGHAQANSSAANLGNSAGLSTYLQAQQQLRDWQQQQK